MKSLLILLGLVLIPGVNADELPKAAEGFVWHEFPNEFVALQVPTGWEWRERDNHPAQTLQVSPDFTENGGFDSGFTWNAVLCRNPSDWKNAYYSALNVWLKATKDIKALGKPTFEKTMQTKDMTMQVFIVEGDMYLPNAPHPNLKYRVRTIVRAFPRLGIVYVYTIGALVKGWDRIWKIGATMFEPIVLRLPN